MSMSEPLPTLDADGMPWCNFGKCPLYKAPRLRQNLPRQPGRCTHAYGCEDPITICRPTLRLWKETIDKLKTEEIVKLTAKTAFKAGVEWAVAGRVSAQNPPDREHAFKEWWEVWIR